MGVQGRYKRNAWLKLVDEGVTPEQAVKQYVELVEKFKGQYGFDPEKVPETIGSG